MRLSNQTIFRYRVIMSKPCSFPLTFSSNQLNLTQFQLTSTSFRSSKSNSAPINPKEHYDAELDTISNIVLHIRSRRKVNKLVKENTRFVGGGRPQISRANAQKITETRLVTINIGTKQKCQSSTIVLKPSRHDLLLILLRIIY